MTARETLSARLRKAVEDESGATLTLFATMFGTLALVTGASLDFARVMSVQSALQRDLDAAVLGAATTSVVENFSADDIANNYFGSNWREVHKAGQVVVTVAADDEEIAATATAPVPMTLMKLAGVTTLDAVATSKVALGGQDVEIALVLDTTGSMDGSKLDELKQAATRLIDTVFDARGASERVKVALVPFSTYVNVGLSRRGESWLEVAPESSSTEEVCSQTRPVTGQSNCRIEYATGYSDGAPYSYSYETCDYEYGDEETQCNTYSNTQTWYGCVGSRTSPLNTRDEQYSSRIPGVMNMQCASELTPLTNDKEGLKSKVQLMTANYDTYIPAGLAWGWRVLSQDEPFTEGGPYSKVDDGKLKKMLVLMTDGANTRSSTSPSHDGSDSVTADNVTVELCNNIKSAGIELYTVAFDVTDTSVLNRMRGCASDMSKFFQTASGEELKRAFQRIGRSTRQISLSE